MIAISMVPSLSLADTLVSGHVTEHLTGYALGGIRIGIWSQTSPFSEDEIASRTTNADGTYAWLGVCPWRCHVSINDERYLYASKWFYWDSGESTAVTADFSLIQPATIAGNIKVDGAAPSDSIDVSISYSDIDGYWASPMSSYQEENGHYVIGRIPPGVSYRLCAGGLDTGTIEQCFDHHDRISLTDDPAYDLVLASEGERNDGIDFALKSGGGISGTLHDAYLGAPLVNTRVTIAYLDATDTYLGYSDGESDANGQYHFKGLPDGSYYVTATIGGGSYSPFVDANQLYPGIVCEGTCPPVTDGQRLSISGGSTLTSIDFTVHPAVVIKGRVTDATSGQGLGSVPIYTSFGFSSATTAAGTGEFVFYLSSHSASFEVFTRGAQPYIDQVYPGIACIQYPCTGGQRFNAVRGDVIEHVDFALQPGAVISGTIYDAATALPGAGAVTVYDSDFNIVWSDSTDRSGSYTSGAWYPGTYYVKAVGYDDLPGCAFYDARPCPVGNQTPAAVMPTPITIGAGTIRSGIDFHLDGNTIFRNGFEA